MQTKTFEVPTLYADHHVIEVRRILLAISGVAEVYASSAFRVIEVTYDETLTNDLDIQTKLDDAGYLGDWSLPVEISATAARAANLANSDSQRAYFRHTEIYETSRQVTSFAQKVKSSSRVLWPCPGVGLVGKMED